MVKRDDSHVRRTPTVEVGEGTTDDGRKGRVAYTKYRVDRPHFELNDTTGQWAEVNGPQLWEVTGLAKGNLKELPPTRSFDNREPPKAPETSVEEEFVRFYEQRLAGRNPHMIITTTLGESSRTQARLDMLERRQAVQEEHIANLTETIQRGTSPTQAPGPSAS